MSKPEPGITAGEFLALYRRRGPFFRAESLDRMDEAKATDRPPDEKGSASGFSRPRF